MLIYKQRYKPRTEREYTKTDLTVYDSAGNTALRGLKVYGKSEVVDGVIKSAGEGYAVVRLADLTWTPYNTIYYATISNKINNQNNTGICPSYNVINSNVTSVSEAVRNLTDNNSLALSKNTSTPRVYIRSDGYSTVEDFVASLGDATLCYQLADPTQGNTIAIKTDDGTGVNGTMATFSTGTPLYGVSADIRDVMEWDGSSGKVTKNCANIDLSTTARTWTLQNTDNNRKLYYVNLGATVDYGASYLTEGNFTRYNSANELTEPYRTATSTQFGVLYVTIPVDADITIMDGIHFLMKRATPTTEPLTQTENESIASLRAFDGTTHIQNNASTDMTVNYTIKVPTNS